MAQIHPTNRNTTQQLLSNISGLFQSNEITETTRNELVIAIKKAVTSHDYTEFLTILNRNTKFSSFPEVVENCKEIIANSTIKENFYVK